MGLGSPHSRRAVLALLAVVLALSGPAMAQTLGGIERDGSLGSGDLVVGSGVDPLGQHADYLITPEHGALSGANLFHSFRLFRIGTNEVATFTGPDGIANVISRVTGGEASQIDGTLRSTIPGADLWLFNPSGVVFGANAQLDVKGSFHAASADFLGFEASGDRFYADLQVSSVLSAASPAAFGFLPETPLPTALAVEGSALTVPDGEALELAGGDVTLRGAELTAPAGSIFLRGGKIEIKEGSQVLAENIDSPSPGLITVAASESLVVDDSLLSVNTSGSGNAGTIRVASPEVTFQNGPGHPLFVPQLTAAGARAETVSTGAGGDIHIDAGQLTIKNGSALSARTVGPDATGDAGAVQVTANVLKVDSVQGWSGISTASAGASGAPGRIDVEAGSIEILNLASVDASCAGCTSKALDRRTGAATVEIVADSIVVQGTGAIDDPNAVVAAMSFGGNGDAGSIVLRTRSLQLLEGGGVGVHAGRAQSNNAGDISIDADSIFISGASRFHSGIFASVEDTSGHAGTIDIRTRTLEIERGGNLDAHTFARSATTPPGGDAGRITIEADSVRIGTLGRPAGDDALGRPRITVGTSTAGNGGTIDITTRTLLLEDRGALLAFSNGAGDAGAIKVQAKQVELRSGGSIQASSLLGGGDAGTIQVTATDSILLDHQDGAPFSLLGILGQVVYGIPSGELTGIFSATVGSGRAGLTILQAPDIAIEEGAFVSTATVGGGDGGAIEFQGDRIRIASGGFVDSTSLPIVLPGFSLPGGAAGSVTLTAEQSIEVVGRRPVMLGDSAYQEWSHVSSAALGSGAPGTVRLEAPRILVDGGAVATTAVPGPGGLEGSAGGDISLVTDEVVVRNGGRVDASSFIAGPGGRVDVDAHRSIVVEGEGSGIASRTGGGGTGGDIALLAPVIRVGLGGEVSAKSEQGLGPVKEIFASLDAEGLLAEPSEATGDAGSIRLAARDLVHLDAGTISTSVGAAAGGDITIDPTFVILEHGSQILATATTGTGGHIQIHADHFFAFPGTLVSADSGDPSLSGTVEIASPDVDLAASLTPLPSSFLDASAQMRERCAARRGGERAGSFAVRGAGGIPAEPDGWLPAPMLSGTASITAAPPAPPAVLASLSGPLLASATCP